VARRWAALVVRLLPALSLVSFLHCSDFRALGLELELKLLLVLVAELFVTLFPSGGGT